MTTTVTESPTTSWAEQDAKADAIRARTAVKVATDEVAAELARAKAAPQIAAAQARAQEIQRKADEEAESARKAREAQEQAEQAAAERIAQAEASAKSWHNAAATIAVICVVVSLPMQISFFWDPKALWLGAVPFVLEGIAFALLKGAAAAIDEDRPSWHYRLGALAVALNSATISYIHGVEVYGLATALGAAFCSIAGPAVWDLHEHGRISKRDGKVPWRVRRAQRAAERRQAKQHAAELKTQRAAELKAQEKAAAYEQAVLDGYAERHPGVWDHARDLAAALGQPVVTREVWARSWRDVHGTEVGDTSEWMTMRAAAEARVAEAGRDAYVHATFPLVGSFTRLSDRTVSAPAKRDEVFDQEAPAPLVKSAAGGDETAGQASRQAARTGQRSRPGTRTRKPGGARPGRRGLTRRKQLTDEQLDARVRALDPDAPTLSARYVAQEVGCDQARAKESLIRTGRYAG
ncbi:MULTISPECIES: hypothetical protein [unclassified Streptomyces]|uniref:hypothetical protein n=1 Tax=unclassified Streptomyces TaxID=2593676 RepID=UPI0033A77DF3